MLYIDILRGEFTLGPVPLGHTDLHFGHKLNFRYSNITVINNTRCVCHRVVDGIYTGLPGETEIPIPERPSGATAGVGFGGRQSLDLKTMSKLEKIGISSFY